MNLHFSRELLPLQTAEITDGCAPRSMDPAAPAMQMLSGYLDRLFDLADDLTANFESRFSFSSCLPLVAVPATNAAVRHARSAHLAS